MCWRSCPVVASPRSKGCGQGVLSRRFVRMRYWWVNQNQTYKHEVRGGYLWSPKRKTDNTSNPFYDFMREVAPGDVIFSFADTYIRAIGVAISNAFELPKPPEFGTAGAYWGPVGWRVDVTFRELASRIKPAQHMDVLAPLLPFKYAPLRKNGAGLQGVYLTLLPEEFAAALIDLIGAEAHEIVNGLYAKEPLQQAPGVELAKWEEHEIERIASDRLIPDTEREAIVLARRGQGLFRKRVELIERACRVTGVDRPAHLRASHCKPWRDATNEERLNGENGLLLTPTIDHLFDRGFIGFDYNGDILISPVAHKESLRRMGVPLEGVVNVGKFSEGQRHFLAYHRENVFLRSSALAKLSSMKRQ
jgi:putative restriction endonuclease